MGYFILLTSDYHGGDAYEILKQRLKSKSWEIYNKTNLRMQLRVGDKVIFYLAGHGKYSQHFVGEAVIKEIVLADGAYSEESNTLIYSTLKFEDITIYKKPSPIKKILEKLIFVSNPAKYGTALNGGVRRILEVDYLTILKGK